MTAVIVPRALALSPAGLLFLKCSAFVVMIVGHADWWLADGWFWVHDTIGRAVFPAFALVLAVNLQRFDAIPLRVLVRLAVAGAVSAPFYAYLQGATFPLNILATYAVALGCLALWRAGWRPVASLLFLLGGLWVDYQWFGVGAVLLGTWALRSGWPTLPVAVAMCLLLVPINGSLWSLLVLPLLAAAHMLHGPAPRLKWLFYVGYPAHLVALAVVKALTS